MAGFLEHIQRCNRFDPAGFVPFWVAGCAVGMVQRDFARALAGRPDSFEVTQEGVALRPELADCASRSEALAAAARAVVGSPWVPKLRRELYPVIREWGDEPLALLDRGAVAGFGIRAFGVHLNGLSHAGGRERMWIGLRSRDKITDGGKLDNVVAGGQPAGLTLSANLVKEADEEASIPAKLARRARPVGEISYRMQVAGGVRRDTLFIYDLDLPDDFTPKSNDGEVERFLLMEVEEVAALVRAGDRFKFNVNLVMIDFLLRSGHLTAANEPEYERIVAGLRGRSLACPGLPAAE